MIIVTIPPINGTMVNEKRRTNRTDKQIYTQRTIDDAQKALSVSAIVLGKKTDYISRI